jgi:hypothetical protein
MSAVMKPPSQAVIDACERLSRKYRDENMRYTLRLDLAEECGMIGHPQLDAIFEEAMAEARQCTMEARDIFRRLAAQLHQH